jgi:GTP-binding protein
MAETEWAGRVFDIVDTGGIDPTGTGPGRALEPLSIGSADFIDQIRAQAEIAIREAGAVLFLTDVLSGVTPADQEVAQILRRLQKTVDGKPKPPVLLVVNKCDNEARRMQSYQFYELGLGAPYPISALHGSGTGDLLDALVATFEEEGDEEEDTTVKIAIVGKPNVGKSSLLNRILGEERAIVSPIPGTTRDAIDTYITYDGVPVTLIDTAGIRRRGRIEPGVEKWSVLRSLQAIRRSDVALLMIDATSGVTNQDTHIAGFILLDEWKSAVILVNKWDAIEKDSYTVDEYTRSLQHELNFMDYVPVLFISAKTGQRVVKVLPLALQVQEERLVHLSTPQINKILRMAQDRHPHPARAGKHFRIYYGTQVRSDPPTFLLYVNDPDLAHFTYLRYLENQFREHYRFLGTPIRIFLRPRR